MRLRLAGDPSSTRTPWGHPHACSRRLAGPHCQPAPPALPACLPAPPWNSLHATAAGRLAPGRREGAHPPQIAMHAWAPPTTRRGRHHRRRGRTLAHQALPAGPRSWLEGVKLSAQQPAPQGAPQNLTGQCPLLPMGARSTCLLTHSALRAPHLSPPTTIGTFPDLRTHQSTLARRRLTKRPGRRASSTARAQHEHASTMTYPGLGLQTPCRRRSQVECESRLPVIVLLTRRG